MIKTFVTLNPGATANDVIENILIKNYALEVSLDEIILFSMSEDGNMVCKKQSEISFITKALLYQEIEEWILKDFADAISTFYSIPVVNMNAEKSALIRSKLKPV